MTVTARCELLRTAGDRATLHGDCIQLGTDQSPVKGDNAYRRRDAAPTAHVLFLLVTVCTSEPAGAPVLQCMRSTVSARLSGPCSCALREHWRCGPWPHLRHHIRTAISKRCARCNKKANMSTSGEPWLKASGDSVRIAVARCAHY